MERFLSVAVVILGITVLILSSNAMALDGEEIINKVDDTLKADTRQSKIQMIIINENDQERERTIEIFSKGEGKGLIEFLAPADVEGTSFLTLEENGDENMWLYLPTVGNVRKIASHMKTGSFMGTDFSYNDISVIGGSSYQDDYDSSLEEEVTYQDDQCFLLETVPTKEEIGYSKMKMWVRKDDYIPLKLEFYDEEQELLKIMENSNIESIDQHLTPQKITMENVQEGTKTILRLEEVEYDVEIPDNIFTTRYIEREN